MWKYGVRVHNVSLNRREAVKGWEGRNNEFGYDGYRYSGTWCVMIIVVLITDNAHLRGEIDQKL